ncbi:hypothetical protein EF384_02510 [Aerococcus agrisoli]|uniref:Helicase Helix-turn-helix domain-containing protein n=1 Tax=Aerococcus agrisoli TaxID=2487350 RepID=A0A3N4GQB4_9LACT|nr:hypothetical protein [Aerococcus agrisoli]RPA61271.1 hypothetical protein EF384_02510 [Aerococcus agrisoli]
MDTLLMAIAYKAQELPANSVYQVLIGKRTATTLFFAFSNHMISHIGLYPKLTKETWAAYLKEATNYPSISAIYRHHAQAEFLEMLVEDILPLRDGLIISSSRQVYRQSLQLMMQVVSYANVHEHTYIPIIQDIHAQFLVKMWVTRVKTTFNYQLADVANLIKSQLLTDLSRYPDEAAMVFLQQFEGAHISAVTLDQVAEIHEASKREMLIVQQALTDDLWARWLNAKTMDPGQVLLTDFVQVVDSFFKKWNDSTNKTAIMMKNTTTPVAEMANKRYLKPSTITEHFVEIAFSQPELLVERVKASLKLADIQVLLDHEPDATFDAFKDRFGEQDYWLYRYWKIIYQKGQDGLWYGKQN